MTGFDDATLVQIGASQPNSSTWLSANAGSGKTKVLTDRVTRLLLEKVDPQHILCLTYTKAAASEMQNRLFKRLGEWAMLSDQNLTEELSKLGDATGLTHDRLSEARRLFASAIETPGGLKIQTIHSFCSALLRRFPLEAGVTPNFTEMDDRTAQLLRAEITEQLAGGPDAHVVDELARHFTGEDFSDLTNELVRHRVAFDAEEPEGGLATLFDLPPDTTEDSIEAQVFLGDEAELIERLLPKLDASGANDIRDAAKLRAISGLSYANLARLEGVFLFGSGKRPGQAKIDTFPSTWVRNQIPGDIDALNSFMTRVEAARPKRLSLAALRRTEAVHAFARAFLPIYDQAKLSRGWLDFDDLILKARDLLTVKDVADWVLYKIDGGIDHILVDEAQDTSPTQWDVIEALGREMSSGEGARENLTRTLFVVGDKKQSIYSFQGADAGAFDRMKSLFSGRLSGKASGLRDMEMEYSFRSSQLILSLVDRVFETDQESGFTPEQRHKAFYSRKPGRVDLWPFIEKPAKQEDPAWYDPVDLRTPDAPASILARRVAQSIKEMIGQPLPNNDGTTQRPIAPGDILILVRRRSHIFHDIIRECKALDLPVAGADRLKVGAEIAVKDIGALLSFLATPEDSLSLATALRSPLFGWTEKELYDLAHRRETKYLWEELRNRKDAYPETFAILDDLRKQVDFLRPYELLEHILTRHDGRRLLLGRLGSEAEDGIDALLAQALAYERNSVDSLTGFLVCMETDELEIKRQMDSSGNRIRVMTIHGAKGLEAPIVILPDTAAKQSIVRGNLAQVGQNVIWRSKSDEAPIVQVSADSLQRRAQDAELDRLLYVAMTRAEQWLIVAGAGERPKSRSTWYDKVQDGIESFDPIPLPLKDGDGLRLESGNWADLDTYFEQEEEVIDADLPAFFVQPAPAVLLQPETLSPSDLGGAKALPSEAGLDEDAAKHKGRQIHKLLEVLPDIPEADHASAAKRILTDAEEGTLANDTATLLNEAHTILKIQDFSDLFGPASLAEVPISANLPLLQGRRIHGVIDRLVLTKDAVLAVDFKTNAAVPAHISDCPEGLLRQMGAYAHALIQIYPDRIVRTALLWTNTATLMHLPHEVVTQALRRAQTA